MRPDRIPWLALASVLALGPGRPASAACAYPTPVTAASCQAAIAYHAQNGGVSLLVRVDGQVVCEDYRTGSGPTVAHPVWSGTKSFSSAMAAAAIEDGLITSFDEVVANTITEWQGDPRKSSITLRQLLGLIGGLDANYGGTPTYAQAIQAPALHDPGTFWEYGPVPYQSFGELMRRKLGTTYPSPLAYLDARILDRIGAQWTLWEQDADGNPLLPHGSHWNAREWIKYGELVRHGGIWSATGERILDQELLDESFHGSAVNAEYGLTWWLPAPGSPAKPCDTVMAFGLGTQKLYVIRSLKLVAARLTRNPWDGLNFSDDVFLDRLLDPAAPQDDCPPAEARHLLVSRSGGDLTFDWQPVSEDATGNDEMIGGYQIWQAPSPDFSGAAVLLSTSGPRSAVSVPGGASAPTAFYLVRALDKCGNVGP